MYTTAHFGDEELRSKKSVFSKRKKLEKMNLKFPFLLFKELFF